MREVLLAQQLKNAKREQRQVNEKILRSVPNEQMTKQTKTEYQQMLSHDSSIHIQGMKQSG